jgi:ubiquinone/menaquinone biosynthesis C-methylase UbiE
MDIEARVLAMLELACGIGELCSLYNSIVLETTSRIICRFTAVDFC